MKLRRQREPQPPLDPRLGHVAAGQFLAFEANLARCRRLGELRMTGTPAQEVRAEALEGARELAYVNRVTFVAMMHLNLVESVPEIFNPVAPMAACARLAYTLTALAEEAPEPETVLSDLDLDGLIDQYEIEEWVQTWRDGPEQAAGDA